MLDIAIGAVAQGILWGIMTLGVYLTYKVLDYSDLSVDGSLALGGAASAAMIVKGIDPVVSLMAAGLMGALAGSVTGLLHTKLKIPPILSGILTMMGLYSVNIWVMMGKANTSLLGLNTVFTKLSAALSLGNDQTIILVGGTGAILLIGLCYWFFGTELGSAVRATGGNPEMSRAVGINTDSLKILCLMISNGLVAFAGGLIAQSQGYAEVTMGTGAIIMGLASIIIGEVLFGRSSSLNFGYKLTTAVLGSIVYRCVIAFVLYNGLKATNLKLFTAGIVAFSLALPVMKQKLKPRRKSKC